MKEGARWTALVDLDEYILLKPPGEIWPPPADHDQNLISLWAHTLLANRPQLPGGLEFRSVFLCATCQPSIPPLDTVTKELSAYSEL